MAGEGSHVPGAAVVTILRPARGVFEVGVGHAQLFADPVHGVGKPAFATRNELSQSDAGIVTGNHDNALEQVFNRDLFARLDKHQRAAHAPGFRADGHQIAGLHIAIDQLFLHHVGCHHFGEAGRGQVHIGIVFGQNGSGGGIQQDVAFGFDGRELRIFGVGAAVACWAWPIPRTADKTRAAYFIIIYLKQLSCLLPG